jgi:hypothetical protein
MSPPQQLTFAIDTGKKVFVYPTEILRNQSLPRLRRTSAKAVPVTGNDALVLMSRTMRDNVVYTDNPTPQPRVQMDPTPSPPRPDRHPAKKVAFKRPRPTRRW